MGTAAIHDLTTHIGQHATLNSGGPRMLIEGVTPDQEYVCSWNDADGVRQVAAFPSDAVQVEPPTPAAPPAATTEAPTPTADAVAAESGPGVFQAQIVRFLGWLSTRDERVGPFSRIDRPIDEAHAFRIVDEFYDAESAARLARAEQA